MPSKPSAKTSFHWTPWLLPGVAVFALSLSVLTLQTSGASFTDQSVNAGNTLASAVKFYPSGLQHHWPFEGNAIDSVGSSDGTITGTTTIGGRVGNALDFDELDDQIAFPDVTYSSDFTLAFDFKIDDNTGTLFKYIYSHGHVNDPNSVNIFATESTHGTDPDVLRTVARDADDTLDNAALQVDISAFIGDGVWHTYALVADSSTGLAVYIDGSLAATDSTRGTGGIDPVAALYVGSRDDLDPDRYHRGGLDTLQIYDRSLSAAEIADQAS